LGSAVDDPGVWLMQAHDWAYVVVGRGPRGGRLAEDE
jgi:hypothetical protein